MRESQPWNIYDVRERFQSKNIIGYNFGWNYRNVWKPERMVNLLKKKQHIF